MLINAKVIEVEREGLVSLIGNRILLFCMRYNYAGILEGVNETCVKLTKAKIVFDTGKFTDEKWAVAEEPKSEVIYVQTSSIESFVAY